MHQSRLGVYLTVCAGLNSATAHNSSCISQALARSPVSLHCTAQHSSIGMKNGLSTLTVLTLTLPVGRQFSGMPGKFWLQMPWPVGSSVTQKGPPGIRHTLGGVEGLALSRTERATLHHT
jgi:hypothetical protein